jgi:hypothetical protein
MRIKFSTIFAQWPWKRQSPDSAGKWGDCEFITSSATNEYDAWVVYEDLVSVETAICPPNAVILITGEPPSIKSYSTPFLAQFSMVLTVHPGLQHPKILHSQLALPWHVGRRVRGADNLSFHLSYDELKKISAPAKTRCCSVICSDKSQTPGHRQRLKFVRQMASHFGPRLDVFGRGIRDIEDKWKAIAPYRYHITLENSSIKHYWTEKLADAFLGGAYPFYYGCPNLAEYFPAGSFTAIDIARPSEAIEIIEAAMAADVAAQSLPQLQTARELVLDRYSLYPVMANLVSQVAKPEATRQLLTLHPEKTFAQARKSGRWRQFRQLFRRS